MKKLFGVVSLFLCVFFASCGFNNQSGSIEFSIPLDDIARLSEQNSSRAAGPGEEYVFLLQVKGSRKYYKSKIQTFELDDSFFRGRSQPVNMKMSSLPSDQTYTVLFDMFMQDPYSNQAYHECTGKTEGVTVTPGKTEEVNLKASYVSPHESYVSLKIDFARPSQTTSGDAGMFSQVNLEKKSNKLYYGSQEIKDIYFVRDSNSHFTDSSFKYKLNYVAGASTTSYDLKFEDDVCSIKDFLLGQSYLYTTCISVEKGDLAFAISIPYIEMTGDSSHGFDPSLLGYQKLIFTKVETNSDGSNRYCSIIPFADMNILDDHNEVLTKPVDEETILAFMNISDYGNNPIRSISRFYYMLYNYSEFAEGETYAGNQCITLPPNYYGNYNLWLPFNDLPNGSEDKKYVMFFFDITSDSLTYEMYCIPAGNLCVREDDEFKTYGFAKVSNWAYEQEQSTDPWVYELKVPLVDNGGVPLSGLEDGKTVKVNVAGTFYSGSETPSELTGEIFDGIYSNGTRYHPLKNDFYDDQSLPNHNRLSIPVNEFDVSGTFEFYSIINLPEGDDHEIYLQCRVPCGEYQDKPMILTRADIFGFVTSN